MPQQTINIGTTPNDGTGDPLRTAFDKVNDNFNELYAGAGAGLVDGDYGDITVGGGGTTMTIDADAVTTSKIKDSAVTGAKIALQRRDVTGAAAILQSDHKITIYFNSASPFNFTIDQLLVNTEVQLINVGSATVTFINGTGVTIQGSTTLEPDQTGVILYNTQTAPIIVTSESVPTATDSVEGVAKLFSSADYATPRTDGALDEATTLSEILNNSFLSQT